MCAHALDRGVSLAQRVERDLEGVLSFAALICEAVAEEASHFELAGRGEAQFEVWNLRRVPKHDDSPARACITEALVEGFGAAHTLEHERETAGVNLVAEDEFVGTGPSLDQSWARLRAGRNDVASAEASREVRFERAFDLGEDSSLLANLLLRPSALARSDLGYAFRASSRSRQL